MCFEVPEATQSGARLERKTKGRKSVAARDIAEICVRIV